MVIGDYDGVTIVPREMIEAALLNAEKKGVYENERRNAINEYKKYKEEGKAVPDLTPKWVVEMMDKLKL